MVELLYMSISRFLLILGVATTLCWLAWVAVLLFMNPNENSGFSIILFYSSLSFAFLGTFLFIGYVLRGLTNEAELPYKQVKTATRQATLFTALIVVALILQSQRFLTWWNLLVLIVLLAFVELFFISYKKYNK